MAATARLNIEPDSSRAWMRLGLAILASTVGGVGMWSVVVILPTVQADFGVARAGASFPYTLTMIGFAFGGIAMGWLADRRGVATPLALGACLLAIGYALSALAPSITLFALAQGLFIGLGSSASFGPAIADISQVFEKRRGIAVALCASGNYLSGAIWPSIIEHFVGTVGWRTTHFGIAIACLLTLLPLAYLLRGRTLSPGVPAAGVAHIALRPLSISRPVLQVLLLFAGLSCCVAMSMPQVHIVAYCGDLGYGVARGAQMLSLMLAMGIISRVASGFVADRLGGLATLLIGSFLQGVALLAYLWADGLTSLFIVSGLFGLFQGGIVPSYAIIVREYFPAHEAGSRVGLVLMATIFGMALGGWLSGLIFDYTGSYRMAFLNGIAWNLVNVTIAAFLLTQKTKPALA